MLTEILKGQSAILKGADIIKNGGVVAFPTETVYGLGANALNESCVKKIYEAKGRPSDNPLIVHVASIDDIKPLVTEINDLHRKLIEKFMPGPITLIFKKSDLVPCVVSAGLQTVGVRMPKNDIARDFIKECGVPIAAPSANASTRVSPTTAEHVYEDMNGRIPLIIDGGKSNVGIESTVLDVTGDIPIILRPGAITPKMLLEVIGEVKTFNGEILKSAPAPGMKYKHYAPIVPTVVAKNIDSLIKEYDRLVEKGINVLALVRDCDIEKLGNRNYVNLGKNDDEVCSNIYEALRDNEKVCDYMICIDLEDDGLGSSIMNRVNKASGGVKV